MKILYPTGYAQQFSYNSAGLNDIVYDSFNRSISFHYGAGRQVKSITTSTRVSLNYLYMDRLDPAFIAQWFTGSTYNTDRDGMLEPVLSSVGYLGSTTPGVKYFYEDSINRFGLTGIVDERGIRYATFEYNSDGYAVKTMHAGGKYKFELAYDAAGAKVNVKNPLDKLAVFNYSLSNQKRRRLDKVDGAASLQCPVSTRAIVYDINSYIASEIDEESRRTTYVRDDRGRPTSITRGAP